MNTYAVQAQNLLNSHGYDCGPPDGIIGPQFLKCLTAALEGDPGGNGQRSLRDPAAFFAKVREKFGRLDQSQVDGINFKLRAMERWPIQWVAYGLATSWHETDKKLQPIEEYGKGRGRKYGVPGPHGGQIAYGRGDVQLTWPDNYAAMDKALGLNGALIADYSKALDPEISARIMVHGMEHGTFTGKGFKSYPLGDYLNYRRIINGTDRDDEIAAYARSFEAALRAGGW